MTFCARILAGSLVAALALVVPPASGSDPADAGPASVAGPGPGPGQSVVALDRAQRYLVRYAGGTDMRTETAQLRTDGVAVRRTFSRVVRAAVVSATVTEAAELAESPGVLAVELDTRVQATQTQPQPPWGLDRIDQRARPLSSSYTSSTEGAGVDLYVVDTGVYAGHSDFGGRVVPGWTGVSDGLGTGDCNGHGTHVAGTAAGSTYGVAKQARIIPVRALDCTGSGWTSDIVGGLNWIAGHHASGTPAVVNLSLGGPSSSTLDAALRAVINEGVVAAVSAGNEAVDACTASPARVPAALTVAATNAYDQQASFSNHGSCVDLYAPGVGIESAWHTDPTATRYLQGTSMSAPHVAGAAALLLSAAAGPTAAEVSAQLVADSTPGVVSWVTGSTPNRLLFVDPAAVDEPIRDPGQAPAQEPAQDPVVESPPGPEPEPTPVLSKPSPARGVAGWARRRAVRVTWIPGLSSGTPLTAQRVRVYAGRRLVRTLRVAPSQRALTVRRLRPAVRYRFSVIALNGIGASGESGRSRAVRPRR